MALSGSFSGSIRDGHYTLRIDWSATQNVANNTSTITADMYLVNDWSLNINGRTSEHSITIDGSTTYLSSSAIRTTGSHYIGSATQTVSHNADGTKTLAMSAVFAIKATLGSYYENITASANITLDTIARASHPTASASSVAMGSSVTLYTNRASSSFTHTFAYSFGAGSAPTIATNVTDSYTWTVPLSFANQFPRATSGTVTIVCQTFNNGEWVGSNTMTLTLTVPSSIKPSISAIAVSDPTGYLSTYGGYIQSKSKAKIAVTAAGSYSSTISSYKITANGSTYTANNSTTGVLKSSGTNTISVTVTDSRGRTATSTTTISVLAYKSPTISTLSVYRCLSDGTADENGAYMKITVGATITSLNNANAKTFTLQWKKSTEQYYPTDNKRTWTSAYSVSESVIVAADVDSSYNIYMTAQDSFSTTPDTSVVGTSFTLMDFRNTGKGIAFGKASEQDAFECNIDAIFKSCATQDGADLDAAYSKCFDDNGLQYATNDTVSYSESNPFTAPSDGYIVTRLWATGNVQVFVYLEGRGFVVLHVTSATGNNLIYVKKGMKLYSTTTSSNGSAIFYPLVKI